MRHGSSFDTAPAVRLTRMARVSCSAIVLATICLLPIPVDAEPAPAAVAEMKSRHEPVVLEAAERFAIPAAWIRAVIDVESHSDTRAVSPKGAIGLMQIMPKTYEELRARYALSADPYDPESNIMAGAAYLREMYDRFGVSGFLAAYNAGPGRYQEHLANGRPLPLETRAYVAQLALRLAGTLPDGVTIGNAIDVAEDSKCCSASLFVARARRVANDTANTLMVMPTAIAKNKSQSTADPLTPPRGALFIPLSGKTTTP
ncbi:lytic transglycosylase domain-containing protein [Pseudorhodoplanes sp.]|uniref:lytic transglycosylase domain-containing protein n=1 Tax=Pseudorhodoplanes sp. TaxID=1934341 RepID=UPI002CF53735|nr:lytic transglycosylase domain-containing protein [Pseudorhodoplanes sp.]HWV51705.1 lytic transglycosylase domain-containing protein [Pseudorhodoplanes sp.]